MKTAQKCRKEQPPGNVSQKVNGSVGQRPECRVGNGFEDSGAEHRVGHAADSTRHAGPAVTDRHYRFLRNEPTARRASSRFQVQSSKFRRLCCLPQKLPNEANLPLPPFDGRKSRAWNAMENYETNPFTSISRHLCRFLYSFTRKRRSRGICTRFLRNEPISPSLILSPIQWAREACEERGGKLPNEAIPEFASISNPNSDLRLAGATDEAQILTQQDYQTNPTKRLWAKRDRPRMDDQDNTDYEIMKRSQSLGR